MCALSSSQHPFGSSRNPRYLRTALLVVSAVWLNPAMAGAQSSPFVPRLSFRQQLDVQVLGAISKDFTYAPSFRITWRRRSTLARSTTLSGMVLFDPLSNSVGGTVGQMFSIPVGGTLLEPFAEAGAAYTDLRVPSVRYQVVDTSGGSLRWIQRYRSLRTPDALAGAGVSWSGVLHEHGRVRLTLGYWQLAGLHGFRDGRLRFGVSLGWAARRDARWYQLATDKTPPTVVVAGRSAARADSVVVAGGLVHVLAQDPAGVAAIEVDGANVRFGPVDAISAHEFGLGDDAVVGSTQIPLPLYGERLHVVVRDSAGLMTRSTVWAVPAPDHTPPTVTVLTRSVHGDRLGLPVQARANDLSGIAYARIAACPAELAWPRDYTWPTERLVESWGVSDGSGAPLEVWDRVGNATRASLPARAPRIPAKAKPPMPSPITATAESRAPGRMSVRVRGGIWDPAGGWIAHVDVDGEAAVLDVSESPSHVEFDGWLVVPADAKTVTLVVTTVDGRTSRWRVPITTPPPQKVGRLYALLVFPDATTDVGASLLALAKRAGIDDPTVLVGSAATRETILDALSRLSERVGPADAVVVHLGGTLTADINALGPAIQLGAGSLDLSHVAHLLRGLDAGATLVSASFRVGRAWETLPLEAPGVEPPTGCYEDDVHPQGSVVDVGPSSTRRILATLAHAGDRGGNGRIRTTELLSDVGVSPRNGLLPFDPLLTLKTVGGGR